MISTERGFAVPVGNAVAAVGAVKVAVVSPVEVMVGGGGDQLTIAFSGALVKSA